MTWLPKFLLWFLNSRRTTREYDHEFSHKTPFFAKIHCFGTCAVQIPERFHVFLGNYLNPPQPSWGVYVDSPTRFMIQWWGFIPSYLKTVLDVRQLRNDYGYVLAAWEQLSLQDEEKLVCSLAPLLFTSHCINLIKDVSFCDKLHSLSEETQGNWGICILKRIEIVAWSSPKCWWK